MSEEDKQEIIQEIKTQANWILACIILYNMMTLIVLVYYLS